MGFGRFIRVRAHRRDPDSTIYVVAEAEEKPSVFSKIALARPLDEYEDLGRDHRRSAAYLASATRPVHPHLTKRSAPSEQFYTDAGK
jgi:hypothetical protein